MENGARTYSCGGGEITVVGQSHGRISERSFFFPSRFFFPPFSIVSWPGSLLFLSFTFSVFRPLPRDVLMLGLFLLLENPSSSCFEAPFSWRCFCLCPYSFAGSAFSRLYLTLHPLPDRSHSRPRPLSLHGAHGLSHWEPLVHTLHPDISPTGRLHLHVLWV